MYYARAVDLTTLVALSSIAAEQTTATENTERKIRHLMDYLYTHNDATVRFHASDMILNIHSDASYLSESRARSRIGGIYFMGQAPHDGRSIQLNGPIHIQASICKFVVASAAEAELGALFYNCQDGNFFSVTSPGGTRTSPTCNTHTLRQQHISIHCKPAIVGKIQWIDGKCSVGGVGGGHGHGGDVVGFGVVNCVL
jgi:hypothetical protein